MKNLIFRVLTALILLPIVIGALFSGGKLLISLLGLVSLLSCLEVANIIRHKNKLANIMAVIFWAGLFLPIVFNLNVVTIFAFKIPIFFLFNMVVLFFLWIDQQEFEKLSAIFYWCSYIVLGLVSIYWLMNILEARTGLSFVLLACVATWANDTFAYLGGRWLGKHFLYKSVSAKKTWEGFFCGACGAVILILVCDAIAFFYDINLFAGLSFEDQLWVLLPSIALAPLGDLIESRLKRLYHTKDASKILPGHGGLLDRIDGLLLVLPWTIIYAFIIRPLC